MHLQRLFTIQQCEDMALITLGQDFGFGEKRATEFLEKFRETFEAYASLCLENAKGDENMDYTKGCIDRELARVMGSAFRPWEDAIREGNIDMMIEILQEYRQVLLERKVVG